MAALLIFLAFGVLFVPRGAEAQQTERVYRIGYISTGAAPSRLIEAFRHGLRDLGYVEGRNLVIEYRSAEGRAERATALAGELVRLKVEIIVTSGSLATRAARNATGTIPVIMLAAGDPVAFGFVASMARPGGNVTGITNISPELNVKRLGLLKESLPSIADIAVLWDPATLDVQLKPVAAAARSLLLDAKTIEAGRIEDFETCFRQGDQTKSWRSRRPVVSGFSRASPSDRRPRPTV